MTSDSVHDARQVANTDSTNPGLSATTEALVARVALGVIALHIVDDSFLQPEPGTSAGDHVVGGLVPLAVLGLAAWGYPRLRAGLRATMALIFGGFGVIVGIEGLLHDVKGGPTGDDFTGLLAIPAGHRAHRPGGRDALEVEKARRRPRPAVQPPGTARRRRVLVAYVILLPFYLSYVFTHVARGFVPTPELGTAYEDVSFTTSDGLVLKGWYIPSKNRAAVIAFPGRKGPQRPARMLARHGYGVLLFDRRGEGESEGDPNILGWKGERDIRAAVAFLQSRPDVDPDRIGAIGLSVGGEMLIEAAQSRMASPQSCPKARASVPSARRWRFRGRGRCSRRPSPTRIVTPGDALFSNDLPPASLEDLSGKIAPTPVFFIYAVPGQGGEAELTETFYEAAREPKEIWLVPGAEHTGGIEAQPEEYERRVVGFFDDALLGDEGSAP